MLRQICALGKTTLSSSPHMTWHIFQVYFLNSARFIGRCAHGILLARGRSSACTTYFPVWLMFSAKQAFCMLMWLHGPVVVPNCMTFLIVSKLSFLLKLIYIKSFFMVLICITKCVSTTDYHKAVSIKQNTFLA